MAIFVVDCITETIFGIISRQDRFIRGNKILNDRGQGYSGPVSVGFNVQYILYCSVVYPKYFFKGCHPPGMDLKFIIVS